MRIIILICEPVPFGGSVATFINKCETLVTDIHKLFQNTEEKRYLYKKCKMDYTSFNHTLDMGAPPEDFPVALKALWWERKNYWDTAHDMVQHFPGKDAAWVHAYLHRKEGDKDNAEYWYRKAEKPFPEINLNEEFRNIVAELLKEYS